MSTLNPTPSRRRPRRTQSAELRELLRHWSELKPHERQVVINVAKNLRWAQGKKSLGWSGKSGRTMDM